MSHSSKRKEKVVVFNDTKTLSGHIRQSKGQNEDVHRLYI